MFGGRDLREFAHSVSTLTRILCEPWALPLCAWSASLSWVVAAKCAGWGTDRRLERRLLSPEIPGDRRCRARRPGPGEREEGRRTDRRSPNPSAQIRWSGSPGTDRTHLSKRSERRKRGIPIAGREGGGNHGGGVAPEGRGLVGVAGGRDLIYCGRPRLCSAPDSTELARCFLPAVPSHPELQPPVSAAPASLASPPGLGTRSWASSPPGGCLARLHPELRPLEGRRSLGTPQGTWASPQSRSHRSALSRPSEVGPDFSLLCRAVSAPIPSPATMNVLLASLLFCALVVSDSEVSGLPALPVAGWGLRDPWTAPGKGRGAWGAGVLLVSLQQRQLHPNARLSPGVKQGWPSGPPEPRRLEAAGTSLARGPRLTQSSPG